jgi:paraquat-inducible protein A
MKIELDSEDDLDNYIICHKCHTIHRKIPIRNGSKALCSRCKMALYRKNDRLVEQGLALSIAGLILFILANIFPLIKINILGTDSFITTISMIVSLLDSGYYIVSLFILYLIIIFPIMIFIIYISTFTLLKLKRGRVLTKELLILLGNIEPWHMSDIFLVSILVSIVKLFDMAKIYIGISFWALFAFVLINIYISRNIHLGELWILRKNVYYGNKRKIDR